MVNAIIVGVMIISLALNLNQLTSKSKLMGILRTGLRKAELDRKNYVRIPYNQLAEEMGWEPEFKTYTDRKTGKTETTQTSVYPQKEA